MFNTTEGLSQFDFIYEKLRYAGQITESIHNSALFNDDCQDHSSSDLISTFHSSNNCWLMMRSERGEHLHFIS